MEADAIKLCRGIGDGCKSRFAEHSLLRPSLGVEESFRVWEVPGRWYKWRWGRFEYGTKKIVQVPIRSTLVPGDPIDQRSRSRSIWCNHFVNPEQFSVKCLYHHIGTPGTTKVVHP
ncbi:unnamed protein product [Phytophthora fragariaefolia]|uniref:Unnamed protein product n=1 Tax=Phytophthora fragariaefolia TaxID=1490495 RepID=A0A9W6WSM9_9STRA|nr:unnamed protein product [Phytophthora fragariaefolia]